MTKFFFKHGIMDADETSWTITALQSYHYPVLLSARPTQEWINNNWSIHEVEGEGCMGETYIKKTLMYCTFPYRDYVLYFLYDKHDYDAVINGLPELVVDPQPFTTVIDVPKKKKKRWWSDM